MLFEDFFENIEFNSDNNTNNLVESSLGLVRGNMFNNEYIPYKNKKVRGIGTKTGEAALLLKIYQSNFALNDINLYLDLHPNDMNMYNYFKKYVDEFKKYLNEYEQNYGPLELCSTYSNNYDWINNPWPWENDGGTKYV